MTPIHTIAHMRQPTPRPALRGARRICVVSVAWAVVVATSALIAGTSAHSIALVGFGLETGVDGFASAVLLWRFRRDDEPGGRNHGREHAARRIVGAVLLIVAAWVGGEAIHALVDARSPTRSYPAVVLACVSLVMLPVLSTVKFRLARRLGSGALRADGVLSAAGAALAAAVLLGLLLNDTLGWGWADPAAAVCIAAAMIAEGGRALRSVGPPSPRR
jgi:divalent metal cation (Fe/Co/Zn/Cd) transporter